MNIGKIIAIDYSKLKVRIATSVRGNSVNLLGELYHFGNIGGYLKTTNAVNETIVCEVTAILDADPHKEQQSFNVESNRDLILKPLGTMKEEEFTLGVSIYPSLYSDVKILTHADMEIILGSVQSEEKSNDKNTEHRSFLLGESKNLIDYQIHLNINRFFDIHSAVLGNSGSGKSNTIAHIIQEILKKEKDAAVGAKIILFDVNGEYKKAVEGFKGTGLNIKCYRPNIEGAGGGYEKFVMPHFLLNLDEWSGFLLATEATQRPFLSKVLQESYRFYELASNSTADDSTKDAIHYFVYRICTFVDNVLGQVDSDTSRMTSVVGMIGKMQDLIVKSHLNNVSEETLSNENIEFICPVQEGNDVTYKGSSNIKNVLAGLKEATSMAYSNNRNSLREAVINIHAKVKMEKVQKVIDKKYKEGTWYSHEYLKMAAEICLMEEDSRGSKNMRNWVSTLLTRLDYFLENNDCEFMRSKKTSTKENYLEETFGIGGGKDHTQLTIIDVSTLSPDILETLTSVVARLIFDHRRGIDTKDRTKNPVHLILDEAHRYIKKNQNYLLKENIFEKIAREGRKYSCYLMISSQRPSEISETVLSQCGNYIVHRIQNEVDMRYVQAIMPIFSQDFADKIKQAVPGEAVIFGNCVPMPLQVAIQKSNPVPSSENCDISEEWFRSPRDHMPNKKVLSDESNKV